MFRLEQLGANQCMEGSFAMDGTHLDALHGHIQTHNPSLAIIESSPLYTYPDPLYPDQAINHPAALNAQLATTEAMSLMRHLGVPTEHWVMIDDVNNGASPSPDIFEGFLAETAAYPLYHSITHLAWEHQFQQEPSDACGIMDARFQLNKLREATRYFMELDKLPLILTVHPTSFQNQQRLMLESLRALLKSDPDACVLQIPKKTKNRLALEPFLHIWTNERGIESITSPQMIGGSIQHIPISNSPS